MVRRLLYPALALAILAGSARADLMTDTFDGVKDAVDTRVTALTGTTDKAEAKLLSTYQKVAAMFAAPSASSATDAKIIAKIAGTLAKAAPGDAELMGLLDDAIDAFVGELEAKLGMFPKRAAFLSPANKSGAKVQAGYDATMALLTGAKGEPLPGVAAKMIGKGEKAITKTLAALQKALLAEGLTGHAKRFVVDRTTGYTGTANCLECHSTEGADILMTAHWKWTGWSQNVNGHTGEPIGKKNLINNFCIALPSNEGRCTQCHIGIGWNNAGFDFDDPTKIDCLVCHDNTGTYSKAPTTAGAPPPALDLLPVAAGIGKPTRKNCGSCHFSAGGGDNVKHGDLASSLIAPTKAMDVHMGSDGGNKACQDCHTTNNHQVAGLAAEGTLACTDCHTSPATLHPTLPAAHLTKVACQTCHIPTFSRQLPTKVEWYWADAGQNISPIPTDQYGKPLYDKMKGTFVWAKDVVPELMWWDGTWDRMILGVNDQYLTQPAELSKPHGSKGDGVSKIYPFKKMIGNQPADAVNHTMLVPHLFGTTGGANPYWVAYDWHLALQEGAPLAGQTYTGTYEFVNTVMYLAINHEVAPKASARGCTSCHDVNTGIDFTKLGYAGNPFPMGQ
jgi:octaheme c-type cytochrome (tetrathionate reductase family)